jgi:RNA polymerase sigma-70 factor (ECF subfamily)
MCDSYIQKVLNGDTDAFRFIIKQHQDDAYSLAMSVVKSEFLAKDVVQNAFIKSYTKLDTFKGNSKFSTWFFRIVINEAFTQKRKQKRQTKISEGISETNKRSTVNESSQKIEEDNQRYYINEALKQIPPKHSLALRLFYLQDFNIEEIKEITGWSTSNTKVILYRARNKVKTLLDETYNIDKEELY